jgi:hypothetical protein
MEIAGTELTLGQFVISLKAASHNPTILNPDFLKREGIIDKDWELADDPLCWPQFARVAFKNDVQIVAEFDNLVFTEALWSHGAESLLIPDVATKYVHALPHVNYQTVTTNPTADLVVAKDEIDSFVRKRFVRDGPWERFQRAKGRAVVEFTYPIKQGFFSLSVRNAVRAIPDDRQVPVMLFDGAFTRRLKSRPSHKEAISAIDLWASDLKSYLDFVQKIIGQ